MPRMGVCAMSFMLSSLCSAVLKGRNQLFETMKRDGAGSLENVVTSSQGHKAQTPNTVPIRSFAKDRIGNSLAHVRYIRVRKGPNSSGSRIGQLANRILLSL